MSDLREAFEAYAEPRGLLVGVNYLPDRDAYDWPTTDEPYQAFKAALQSQTAPAVPEGWRADVERAASLFRLMQQDDESNGLWEPAAVEEDMAERLEKLLAAAPQPDHYRKVDPETEAVIREAASAGRIIDGREPDAGKVECHAPGDRCRACPHYFGKSDRCDYAISPCTAVDGGMPVEVTLRRVKDWRWKNDPCSVVHAPAQYEWTVNKPEKKPEEYPSWLLAGEIVEILVHSGKYSATRCADHFHDISKRPGWADDMEFEIQIGELRFYCSDEEDWRRPK